MIETRFLIDDIYTEELDGWYAILDEEAGGYTAYFSTLDAAVAYRDGMMTKDLKEKP